MVSVFPFEVWLDVLKLISLPAFWLALLLCLVASMLPVVAVSYVYRVLAPQRFQLVQEIEKLPKAARSALLSAPSLNFGAGDDDVETFRDLSDHGGDNENAPLLNQASNEQHFFR